LSLSVDGSANKAARAATSLNNQRPWSPGVNRLDRTPLISTRLTETYVHVVSGSLTQVAAWAKWSQTPLLDYVVSSV
jgi:hypothetical protein